MQLDKLWEFMQVDMETDTFENQMRQSPNRQRLIKQRNFLMEQQNNMKKLEADVAVMQDRLEAVEDEAKRLESVLSALSAEVEGNPPQSIEEANQKAESALKLVDTLRHYEQELQKMRKDAEARDRQQKEIRVRAAKTKQEYDQLKQVYDQEFKRDTQKLNQMRANIEREAAKLDPILVQRYRTIKQHCTPPMAKLVDGQCSGCFMSLPSATLRELKLGEKTVECDNCGRILYDPKD
ncbi:MAG TPA: hypothetical protein IAB02_05815 [Candidatus Pullichristensenella excrementigallinarum]|uniref:C4-type zinc ribbon domain-containing protein n=1 Tax=Candidatus Pullichristensenella excrementigallinarum TaxID=2840907 RepID=A0A9D1LCV3_9FIRM|nr:hypothetical protein [Candidatus Pullichristensenella excrementigallinarum]